MNHATQQFLRIITRLCHRNGGFWSMILQEWLFWRKYIRFLSHKSVKPDKVFLPGPSTCAIVRSLTRSLEFSDESTFLVPTCFMPNYKELVHVWNILLGCLKE
jgi:hypothetical protein